ncbi:MAG: TerC family protein [Candidatus Rokubacteria bacterium]|nr:TerC family protein [Candidatus Rokubacteria bacterium]
MSADLLFPFAQYWWLYAAFTGGVLVLLALDLGVFHRDAHAVGIREAAVWSGVWVLLALAFNLALWRYALWAFPRDPRLAAVPGLHPEAAAGGAALEFLTGYVVEKSLSVDNIFIFVMIFGYFAVPATYQHRVLFYGIAGALVFRSVFIALGALLLHLRWIAWLFGAFLVLTGLKMMLAPAQGLDPEKNPVIRLFRRVVPVTPDFHGPRFFVRLDGALHATPLFVALLFVEITDVIFAVDSVPAIFALTSEPLIVYTSNVFAILGLRAMYFLLADLAGRFHLLKYGLALVLVFVGLKMAWLNEAWGGKFPIGISLGIIGGLLAASVLASLLRAPAAPPRREGDGAGPPR